MNLTKRIKMGTKHFKYSDFSPDQNESAEFFLAHAIYHKQAADIIFKNGSPLHYDSVGYLYHIAFEQLFKSVLLDRSGCLEQKQGKIRAIPS